MRKIVFKLVIFTLLVTFLQNFTLANDETSVENSSLHESDIEASSITSDEPIINARHATILDRHSKSVVYGKNENEQCKMASTTKIMTAIIVIEKANLSDIVDISLNSAGTGGSRLGLSKNDRVSVEHLLYGLMMRSGNDAAVALAENTAGSIENFALLMNQKAKELNLSNTNFVSPHGLDDDMHYTSAFDLAILADYALNNKIFSKIVNTKTFTIHINGKPKTISNTNELLGNFEGIYGVKTGFTNGANRCLVTACKRGDLDFICVVLGCDTKKDRTRDSIKLFNYAFKNFSLISVKDIAVEEFYKWRNSSEDFIIINKGKIKNLNLYLNEKDFSFTNIAIKTSEKDKVHVTITFSSYFEAPLAKNTQIGNLILFINNKRYYSVNIFNNTEIPRKKYSDYILCIFKNYCYYFTKKLYIST